MTRVTYTDDGSKQRVAARRFADDLETFEIVIRRAAAGMGTNLDMIDWVEFRNMFEDKLDNLFEVFGLTEDDAEDDIIEGEEHMDIDTTLHPLDPDNEDEEDDSWHEGFDDA